MVQYLDAVSALAVILGVIFVIFQLRQNAKLIEASNKQIETSNRQVEANLQQNLQTVILSTIDRFTDESFIKKRKKVRDIIKRYQTNEWKDFLESEDDYEVRGFLGLYEATGYLAKAGIVNVEMLAEGMGLLLITDWVAVQPAIELYRAMWKRENYPNFRWLAGAVKGAMEKVGLDLPAGFRNP